MKKICMWLAVASLAVIAACQNDQNGNVELLISADTLNVSGNGGTAFVTVFINGSAHWSVAGGAEWCSLNRTSGDGFGEGDGDTVRITVAENPSFEEPRNAVFTFTAGNAVHAVTVEQEALNSLLTIPTNNTSIVLPAKDTTITLFVESNLDTWTATSNREWCVISPPLSGSGNGTLTVHLNANPELYQRSGMVTLTSGTVKLNKPISQTPGGEYPATTVWKVLWVICPAMDVVYNGKPYKTFMTADEIELVKQKAPWYEEFIEEHTHGALDIEITIEVLRDTVTSLHGGEGPKMSVAERTRIQPETFDSQIFTADYTGISTNGWRAVTYPNCMYSIIPFMHTTNSGWSYEANTAETKQYQRNLYVHEWCHQVEWYFPSIVDGKYAMPTLHDNGGAQYNYNNTGLNGEAGLAKWYADFVGGTIEMYPNANNVNQGVYAGWWQFNPLKQGYTQRWYENE